MHNQQDGPRWVWTGAVGPVEGDMSTIGEVQSFPVVLHRYLLLGEGVDCLEEGRVQIGRTGVVVNIGQLLSGSGGLSKMWGFDCFGDLVEMGDILHYQRCYLFNYAVIIAL
jgi:hypothetical protein